jgi:hypothetical protein
MGNDNEGDNLATYSDGHSWCYSCGYYVKGDLVKRFKGSIEALNERSIPLVHLPLDSSLEYPQRALDWVYQYGLTRQDLLSNDVLWSDYYHRLIFPVFGYGELLAWQGRYFGDEPKNAKWFGRGNLKDTFHFLGTNKKKLILTEDIVSAIKVSKYSQAMPLFGCIVGIERAKRIHQLIDKDTEVLVWLDPDKRKQGLKESAILKSVGCLSRVIWSDKDPKEHSEDEIERILYGVI